MWIPRGFPDIKNIVTLKELYLVWFTRLAADSHEQKYK